MLVHMGKQVACETLTMMMAYLLMLEAGVLIHSSLHDVDVTMRKCWCDCSDMMLVRLFKYVAGASGCW